MNIYIYILFQELRKKINNICFVRTEILVQFRVSLKIKFVLIIRFPIIFYKLTCFDTFYTVGKYLN